MPEYTSKTGLWPHIKVRFERPSPFINHHIRRPERKCATLATLCKPNTRDTPKRSNTYSNSHHRDTGHAGNQLSDLTPTHQPAHSCWMSKHRAASHPDPPEQTRKSHSQQAPYPAHHVKWSQKIPARLLNIWQINKPENAKTKKWKTCVNTFFLRAPPIIPHRTSNQIL